MRSISLPDEITFTIARRILGADGAQRNPILARVHAVLTAAKPTTDGSYTFALESDDADFVAAYLIGGGFGFEGKIGLCFRPPADEPDVQWPMPC
jgi:hypothetical protein